MSEHQEFWDRIADKYAARQVGDPEAYQATLSHVRNRLTAQMSVLEIGCGTGATAVQLCDAVAKYTGTDAAAGMIRIAQSKPVPEGASLRFVQTDAQSAVKGSYDAVLAFNVVHLVEPRAALLQDIRAHLPKGGLFISKTPCLGAKWWFRPLIKGAQWLGKAPRPIALMRPAQLRAEIEQAGFEILETGDYPKSLPNHFVVAQAV